MMLLLCHLLVFRADRRFVSQCVLNALLDLGKFDCIQSSSDSAIGTATVAMIAVQHVVVEVDDVNTVCVVMAIFRVGNLGKNS
jgi:hypothetical protein